jgi:hypothetical protein
VPAEAMAHDGVLAETLVLRRSWGTISLCLDMLGKEHDFSSLL